MAPQDIRSHLDGEWSENTFGNDNWGIGAASHIAGVDFRIVADQVTQRIEASTAEDGRWLEKSIFG